MLVASALANRPAGDFANTLNTGTWTGVNDLGLSWNASGGIIQLNGGTVATDSTARTPSATFHLGASNGSSFFFRAISQS